MQIVPYRTSECLHERCHECERERNENLDDPPERIPAAEQFIEEVERSLHDAIMVVKRAVKNGEVVAGGGAAEVRRKIFFRGIRAKMLY